MLWISALFTKSSLLVDKKDIREYNIGTEEGECPIV